MAQLSEVSVSSDAFFPFSDNIYRAKGSGVQFVAAPSGSVQDEAVVRACDDFGMVMCFLPVRLFHH